MQFQRANSKFRGENNQQSVVSCGIIIYKVTLLEGQPLLNKLYAKMQPYKARSITVLW